MKIFLDMDGVLVDFLKGIHDALGADYDFDNYPYEKGKWDMFADIGGFNLPFKVIDALCTSDFWADLDWMPDGRDILREVINRQPLADVYLLTTPMPNLGSASGKMRWVAEHLPHMITQVIVTQAPKALLAGPDRILIDDKDQNIDEWVKAGGIGVLVPRPWNRLRVAADNSAQFVARQLREVIELLRTSRRVL